MCFMLVELFFSLNDLGSNLLYYKFKLKFNNELGNYERVIIQLYKVIDLISSRALQNVNTKHLLILEISN